MTDIEKAMDLAAERKRDADVDKSFVVTDEDYPEPPPCIYTRETWHSDCGEYMSSDDPDKNDRVRMLIKDAHEDMAYKERPTVGYQTMRSKWIADRALQIGFIVIQNAIDNGLTVEMLGERTDDTV